MAAEDYTTYTEVDIPANRIQFVGTNHLDFNPTRNEEVYLHDDKGVGHFLNFTHDVDVKGQDITNDAISLAYVVANVLDDWYGLWVANEEHIGIAINKFHALGPKTIVLLAKPAVATSDVSIALAVGTWYYLRLVKTGTAIRLGIYSTAVLRDAGDGTDGDVDNLSLTHSAVQSFRYIYACNTRNDGNVFQSDVDIENLDLHEVVVKCPVILFF